MHLRGLTLIHKGMGELSGKLVIVIVRSQTTQTITRTGGIGAGNLVGRLFIGEIEQMNAQQKVEEFRDNINAALKMAIQSGLATGILLLELDDLSMQLRMLRYQQKQDSEARKLASSIIPANGSLLKHS